MLAQAAFVTYVLFCFVFRMQNTHMPTEVAFKDCNTFLICLPLDEVIASKAILVIVSGLDGRTDGRKRFWNHLNNSKTVRDRQYVSMGS